MTELFQELLVEEADEELGWQERALCAQTDPESFFPEKGGSTREAKKVCLACEVRSECLEYALANDERFGIWGGLSERERHAAEEGSRLNRPHRRRPDTYPTVHHIPNGPARTTADTTPAHHLKHHLTHHRATGGEQSKRSASRTFPAGGGPSRSRPSARGADPPLPSR